MTERAVEIPLAPPPGVPEERSHGGGDGLVVFSACCFGALPILGESAYRSGMRLLPLLAWRFLMAAVLLWILLGMSRRARRLPLPRVAGFLGMGVIYLIMSLLYFQALRYSPISTLTLIFYTYPALVTLLAAFVLKEALTRVKAAALILALAGCILVLNPREMGDGRGAALAFAAAAIYSGYVLIGTRLTRGVDPLLASTWVLTTTTFLFVAIALGRGEMAPPRGPGAWGSLAGLAVVSTVVAEVAFFAGLPRTGASRAAILSTVEPLFTLFLSALFLGEAIPAIRYVGGGVIVGSVLLLHRETRR